MENVGVGLQATTIARLQFAQFLRLRLVRIDGKGFVNKEAPNFFAALSCVKPFVLRVADAAKLLVRCRRLRAVKLTHELDDALALVDFFPQH
jgi:hypothetical protein